MFFKKTDKKEENNFIVKVCALLIHAAKIDENYTDKEEEIIKKTLLELGLESEKITKWAFRDFTVTSIFPRDYKVARASVWIGETDYVDLKTKEEVTLLIPYGKKNDLRAEAHVKTPLMTPIKVNDEIGILKIIAPSFIPGGQDRVIEYPLISGVQVDKGSFVKKIQAAARMGILTALKFSIPNDLFN